LDETITEALKEFLKVAFGWKEGRELPALEDIFTCIDLSAGTGHTLGIQKYTPKVLRALRRMAIYRIFSILDRRFSYSRDIDTLLRSYCGGGQGSCAFIALNWDIVLEKHLSRLAPAIPIDYGCFCFDWNTGAAAPLLAGLPVCKMHGSSNWVYCENCKSLFFDLHQKLSLNSKAGLIKSDFRLFDERFRNKRFDAALGIPSRDRECRFCRYPVSSHIATFSYRKSFRTHAYPSVWYRAERLLSDSDRWVFIGYSLPEADYELKQVLKAASLRMQHRRTGRIKVVDVVMLNDTATQTKFERFFGADNVHCFQGGLAEYVSKLDG